MTNRIMLVEDEIIIALDIQHRLRNLGYQVVGHSVNGGEAVQHAKDLSPELILMDIKISGEMDGIEAAAHIRAFSDIPIIYLTAFADSRTLERARVTGASGYLIKPFNDNELQSVIEMALYKHVMERKLRESEERYALAVRATNDGIWDWDLATNEIYYSPRWKEMLGLAGNEALTSAEDWFNRVHPEDRKNLQIDLVSHLKGLTPKFESEYRIRHANGEYLWALSRGLALRNGNNLPYRMAGSQSDITARKLAEERLAHTALHDSLTGLPNRVLFMDRLEYRLEQTKRDPDDLFAVLFIDVDRFKVVNDSLGHAAGDELLTMIAQRLKQCLRPEDTVSRLGGDEFAILLNEVKSVEDAYSVTDRIRASLVATAMLLGGVERSMTVSIGIAMFNKAYTTAGDLLRDSDSAMYHAKALGGNRSHLFNVSMYTSALELLQIEGDLKRAVDKEEWLVQYQPIISLSNGNIVGAEALLRWAHPRRGVLAPSQFIHVAEETGFILPIGDFVLRSACRQAKAWRDAGHRDLWVSVNISCRQFQDKGFVERIVRILSETGLPSDGLRLEITESVAAQNMDHAIDVVKELGELGVRTSLDDFGIGYSSFNYLKRLPIKSLKIDQSFIHDMDSNIQSESLASGIISMARSLDLEVVAEGVEKESQLMILRKQLCDNVQGFLISHPVSGLVLESMLAHS